MVEKYFFAHGHTGCVRKTEINEMSLRPGTKMVFVI